jgi:inorganic triphosphatase YgiF
MATETELKLAIQTDDVAEFLTHPLLQQATNTRAQQFLLNTYYDTDNALLYQHKIALRVRQKGALWVQTIKGAGQCQAGLHQRHEWETPIDNNQLNFKSFQPEALGGLLTDERIRQQIKPLFTTHFQRTTWQLQNDTGDKLELCLDQGHIAYQHQQSPICEVELELLHGQPIFLYQTALQLIEVVPLMLENASKAQRGYQLMGLQTPVQAVNRPYHTPSDHDEAFLFSYIYQYHIQQIYQNHRAAQQGDEHARVYLSHGFKILNALSNLFPNRDKRYQALQTDIVNITAQLHGIEDLAQLNTLLPYDREQRSAYDALFKSLIYNRFLLNVGHLSAQEPAV